MVSSWHSFRPSTEGYALWVVADFFMEREKQHHEMETTHTRKHRSGHGMLKQEDKFKHFVTLRDKPKLISQSNYTKPSWRN